MNGTSPPAERRRASSTNPSFLALLRVDLEALVRGRAQGDELCEIAGVGPVPAGVARGLLGDAIVKLVVTRGVDVVNVTNLGRGPSAAQRIASLWSAPACTNVLCSHTLAIQHDHRTPWAQVHETALENLDRLCPPCHKLKTHQAWALVEGKVRRPLVPPDDPRHPDNTGAPDSHDGPRPPAPPTTATDQPESHGDVPRPSVPPPTAIHLPERRDAHPAGRHRERGVARVARPPGQGVIGSSPVEPDDHPSPGTADAREGGTNNADVVDGGAWAVLRGWRCRPSTG